MVNHDERRPTDALLRRINGHRVEPTRPPICSPTGFKLVALPGVKTLVDVVPNQGTAVTVNTPGLRVTFGVTVTDRGVTVRDFASHRRVAAEHDVVDRYRRAGLAVNLSLLADHPDPRRTPRTASSLLIAVAVAALVDAHGL